MSDSVIQLIDLNKKYSSRNGEINALQDVNLDIERGDIVGIIGFSGAGKSTLVRCINLLEKPTSGQVLVNGEDISKLKSKQLLKVRQKMGMIFQGFNLLSQRNVLKNVLFPFELAKVKKEEAKERAIKLLTEVGLSDKLKSYPSELSGGQQQRVAIARALALNPEVLLCDEATSALDPETTSQILALLKDINKKYGITVVIITHQLNILKSICSHVAVLEGGKIQEYGEIDQVFSSPSSEATKRLLAYEGGVL